MCVCAASLSLSVCYPKLLKVARQAHPAQLAPHTYRLPKTLPAHTHTQTAHTYTPTHTHIYTGEYADSQQVRPGGRS